MKNKFEIKKCSKCGAIVEILKPCTCEDCGIKCCGENMQTVKPNSTDASFEKHVPVYVVEGEYIVASVPHVMEQDHYIEYIALDNDNAVVKEYFNPGEEAKVVFPYVKGSTLYAYCNKHGLWSKEVE